MSTNIVQISNRTFAMGVLGITASVLFVGLMLVMQQPAQAIGMNDRGGDYIMLTQQVSNTTEAVVVIDGAAKQMIIYAFDYNAKRLEILSPRIPLDQLPPNRPAEPAAGNRGRR